MMALAGVLVLAGGNRPALVTVEAARACVAKLIDPPVFLLGSKSASRRALLEATGASFDTLVPNIDEAAIGDRTRDAPASIVERIATAKADALIERLRTGAHPPLSVVLDSAILLTGDQVVTFAGAIREKPVDRAEARRFIESYAHGAAGTVQAVCLHDLATGARTLGVSVAEVHIEPIPPADVDTLLGVEPAGEDDATGRGAHAGAGSHGDLMECAGGLMVEHPLVAPRVTRVAGGLDSVMGLSTRLVASLLLELRHGLCSAESLRPGGARQAVLAQRHWAVVGDVLNPNKAASRIVGALRASGRELSLVNPRDSTGACKASLTEALAAGARIDAINLVIAPAAGVRFIEEAHALGIRYVFAQPGADSPGVLARARELGLVVVTGCVLVEPLPPPLPLLPPMSAL